MTWWGWLLLALYLLVAIQTWRTVGYSVASHEASSWGHREHIDGGNIGLGLLLGFLAGVAWPAVLPIRGGLRHGIFIGAGRSFLAEPRYKRREAELREREQRIERLEREVGIQ